MNFILAYTPFAWPSAPPLGVSILKSFVQSHAPGVNATAVDLNLDLFTNAGHFAQLVCSSCPAHDFSDCISLPAYLEGDTYKNACGVLGGGLPGFDDPRTHVESYLVVRSFLEQAKKCCARILRPYVEGKTGADSAAEALLSRHTQILIEHKPDILGFSTQSDQAHWALGLSKWIKQRLPETTIVIGGYFPSYCGGKAILEAFDFVDYAVQGEGEKAAAILCAEKGAGKSTAEKDSSLFKGTGVVRRSGNIIIEEENEPVKNIDEIPFADFSDFDLKKYFTPRPVLPVLASRGCPWGKCAFCAHRANYSKRFRERSPESMALELSALKENFGVQHFLFCDEQVSGRRLESLSEKLVPLDIEFGLAGLKPEKRVTANRLSRAYDAGCRWVYLGVESFTCRILDRMNKGTKPEEIIEVIKNCRNSGIVPFNSYIWGFPGQSRSDIDAEAKLIEQNKNEITLPDDGHPFTLEEGSPVAAAPSDYGVEILARDIMFDIGSTEIFSGTLSFRPLAGLTPYQAQNAYRPVPEVPYESHSFWESLLLLACGGTKLLFDREEFFGEIVNAPQRKILVALKKRNAHWTRDALDAAACLSSVGEHEEAAGVLREALSSANEGDRQHLVFSLALSLMKAGSFSGALDNLELLNEDDTSFFREKSVEYHMGVCHERLGDLTNAVKSYKKVVETGDTIIGAYRVKALGALGGCLVRSGHRKDGIRMLLASRMEDTQGREAAQIAFMLSLAYELEGDTEAMERENKLLKSIM